MQIIDIEGTDGSGKFTQTKLLYDSLTNKGFKCLIISFPNYDSPSSAPAKMFIKGELGQNSNCLNGYQASSLFAVDRLITIKKLDLEQYDYVLFDRYTPSNMIHQSTRIDNQQELDKFLDWIFDFEYEKLGLPIPNKIIFLDMPPKASIDLAHNRTTLKVGGDKDILEQDLQYMLKSYDRAKYVANKYNWDTINCYENKIKSIEQIHQEILTKLSLNDIL